MNWYPIFYREMLLFKKKIFKLGYVFSSILFPFIYLLAFGLGLGRNVTVGGASYIEFLLPGIVALTSMTNSYNLVSNALSMGRLYFKSFQVIMQSPVSHYSVMVGIVFSGMMRGLIAAAVIMLGGILIFQIFPFTPMSFLGLILNALLFSCMGVVVGMLTKDPEDNAIYTNFFIMPMAFFSGTFFPIDNLPYLVKTAIMLMPLSYANILVRSSEFSIEVVMSIAILLLLSVFTFLWGARLIKNYSE